MSGPMFGDGWLAKLVTLFILLFVWLKDHWLETLLVAFIVAGALLLSRAAFGQQMPERAPESAIPEVAIQKDVSPDISPERQLFAAYRLGMEEYQAPAQPHGLGQGLSEALGKLALYTGIVVVVLLVLVIGFSSGWW